MTIGGIQSNHTRQVAAVAAHLGLKCVTVQENWSGLGSCLQFWHDFVGSQIRPVEWTCEKCAAVNREDVGASVGETFSRACRCGKVKRITTVAYLPPMRQAGKTLLWCVTGFGLSTIIFGISEDP